MQSFCRRRAAFSLGLGLAGCTSAAADVSRTSAASSPPPPPSAQAADPRVDPRFDAEQSAATYPFPVRFFEFQAQRQKLRMAYMDVRPERPNGRVVLLLHGKNFSSFYWEPTLRRLVSRGFRVIAPDQVGFGKSSKPSAYQFSFQGLAESTRALLLHLGVEQTAVVGHSMGGMLAARFALSFPAQTEKLVLVAPLGLEDWKRLVAARSVDQGYAAELAATPESIREYQRKSYYAGAWKPEYEALMAPAAGSTRHRDYPKVAWCSALTSDMIFNQPVVYELADLRVATLLIIGLRDRTAIGSAWSTPQVAAKLGRYEVLGKQAAAMIPGARLLELPGVGHLPQVEAFEAYAEGLLAFLDTPHGPSSN